MDARWRSWRRTKAKRIQKRTTTAESIPRIIECAGYSNRPVSMDFFTHVGRALLQKVLSDFDSRAARKLLASSSSCSFLLQHHWIRLNRRPRPAGASSRREPYISFFSFSFCFFFFLCVVHLLFSQRQSQRNAVYSYIYPRRVRVSSFVSLLLLDCCCCCSSSSSLFFFLFAAG